MILGFMISKGKQHTGSLIVKSHVPLEEGGLSVIDRQNFYYIVNFFFLTNNNS